MNVWPDDWCAFHNVSEPYHPEEGDRCCGECLHTFKSGELARLENELFARWAVEHPDEDWSRRVESDDEVRACPLCSHDL